MHEILNNIKTNYSNLKPGKFPKVGHTLSQDEIASDGRACYLERTDSIGGLSEHAVGQLSRLKMGEDLMAVRAVATAVKEGRVRIAKEFSVAAISRHARSNYGAKPVLLMPTCKQGTWKPASLNLLRIVDAWAISPFGEQMHGSIWSIASDGDATRRAGMYVICMHEEFSPSSPLYENLGALVGLNLFTGKKGLIMDFDIKHLFKRVLSPFYSQSN
jgi:hypothetical protein